MLYAGVLAAGAVSGQSVALLATILAGGAESYVVLALAPARAHVGCGAISAPAVTRPLRWALEDVRILVRGGGASLRGSRLGRRRPMGAALVVALAGAALAHRRRQHA